MRLCLSSLYAGNLSGMAALLRDADALSWFFSHLLAHVGAAVSGLSCSQFANGRTAAGVGCSTHFGTERSQSVNEATRSCTWQYSATDP